ncbi:MAG: alkaline phosphatase family protein, partial [Bdellovibrionia bacterium]
YIAMISGSTQGVDSNDDVDLPMKHIGDLLEKHGKTWRAYGEDYPGNCYLGGSSGNYVRKHMPFLSFESVQRNKARCNRVVSAKNFGSDVAHSNLANLSLYIPNQLNNGHDTGVEYADHWLGEKMLPMLEQRSAEMDTLFVVTFDEGSIFGDNKIYTVLFGAGIQEGIVSDHAYSHFSLLKTIEMILGVPNLGLNDASADFIDDVWKTD